MSQDLREQHGMQNRTAEAYGMPCLCYTFCGCCEMVKELRYVEAIKDGSIMQTSAAPARQQMM